MNREERKSEIKLGKIFISIPVFIILIVIYAIDYDFNNRLWNGLILFGLSSLVLALLTSEKYFIETGGVVKEDVHTEQYKIFNQMHPMNALRNKIIGFCYVITTIVSIGMVISSFVE